MISNPPPPTLHFFLSLIFFIPKFRIFRKKAYKKERNAIFVSKISPPRTKLGVAIRIRVWPQTVFELLTHLTHSLSLHGHTFESIFYWLFVGLITGLVSFVWYEILRSAVNLSSPSSSPPMTALPNLRNGCHAFCRSPPPTLASL